MTPAGRLRALFCAASEPRAPASEIAPYRERLPASAGPCLEAMCGYGRLLVPLLEAGVNLHGIDHSAAMLAECESALARVKRSSTLFRQDVAELNVPFRYAGACIAAGAFQRLTRPDRAQQGLARIRAHLVEPGLLWIDLYEPSQRAQRIAAPQIEVRSATLDDGSRIAVRSETTMHAEARLARIENRYVHRLGNELLAEESDTLDVTWYAEDEIEGLLAQAGFRDVAFHPSPRACHEERTYSVCARAV